MWPSLFYGVRVSFGLALVLSIVLIFTTIAVAGSASTYVCKAPVSLGQNQGQLEPLMCGTCDALIGKLRP